MIQLTKNVKKYNLDIHESLSKNSFIDLSSYKNVEKNVFYNQLQTNKKKRQYY